MAQFCIAVHRSKVFKHRVDEFKVLKKVFETKVVKVREVDEIWTLQEMADVIYAVQDVSRTGLLDFVKAKLEKALQKGESEVQVPVNALQRLLS